jgi:acetate kinase
MVAREDRLVSALNILALNSGSSSLKFGLYRVADQPRCRSRRQPASLAPHVCTVANGTGTVGANVDNVTVTCVAAR